MNLGFSFLAYSISSWRVLDFLFIYPPSWNSGTTNKISVGVTFPPLFNYLVSPRIFLALAIKSNDIPDLPTLTLA